MVGRQAVGGGDGGLVTEATVRVTEGGERGGEGGRSAGW